MRETKTTSLLALKISPFVALLSTEKVSPDLVLSSIGSLIGSQCGSTSSKANISQETIPISLCKRDVTDISTEYDLILSRAGAFDYDEEFLSRTTVFPRHRYQLGGGWYQKRVCRYPDHKGKARPDRSISKLQS